MTRHAEAPTDLAKEMTLTSPIKILFVSANALSPVRLPIRPEEEYRRIESKLRAGKHARLFKLLLPLFATRIEDLQEGLGYHRPHVLHFAGHATPSGIELEHEDGYVAQVDIQTLTRLCGAVNSPAFGSGGNVLKLVVLHACSTATIAEALTTVVDFAVGMPNDVWDKDSINFGPAFYSSLANGQSLEAALQASFAVTRTKNYFTNHTPRLFHRPGTNPAAPFIAHILGQAVENTQPPSPIKRVSRPPKGPREKPAEMAPPGKRRRIWDEETKAEINLGEERKRMLEARRKKR